MHNMHFTWDQPEHKYVFLMPVFQKLGKAAVSCSLTEVVETHICETAQIVQLHSPAVKKQWLFTTSTLRVMIRVHSLKHWPKKKTV